jgi:hypothetical protein
LWLEDSLQFFYKLALGDRADDLLGHLPIFKNQQRWDAADSKVCGKLLPSITSA